MTASSCLLDSIVGNGPSMSMTTHSCGLLLGKIFAVVLVIFSFYFVQRYGNDSLCENIVCH